MVSTMDTLEKRRVILILCLGLIYFCELLQAKGLCDFEEMFPSAGKKRCFKDDVIVEDNGTMFLSTKHPQVSVIPCPLNMIFGNCTCMATCGDPKAEINCYNNCTEDQGCYCPDGFLMKGEQCIPVNECGCFLPESGEVIPINMSYVNTNCSRRCVCRNDVLVCEDDYACSPYAVCETRNSLRACYCKDGFDGDGQNCSVVEATDCYDIFNAGFNTSGVYTIQPINSYGILPFEVYCNMDNGGGWTVFQRRMDGSVDFYRGWEDYKQGFGSVHNEFWLGNDKIAILTNQKDYELRIDFKNSVGTITYATYTLFRVGDEVSNYRLTDLGQYTGTSGLDQLDYHRGYMFSTFDRDNDAGSVNCAQTYHGAWWYNQCYYSNLNGGYFDSSHSGIYWVGLSETYKITHTEMKINPTGT